eukprot:Clim_evm10s165 gene=Clim_evmTU10s165
MADIEYIKSLVAAIPDFPKPGILFRDIFPVFHDPVAVQSIINHLAAHIQKTHKDVHAIVGLDARGFLIGPPLAMALGAKFVPVRKKGKLPGECVDVEYKLEYGSDHFEMQKRSLKEGENVIIVDDLLATGGTLSAANELCKLLGATVLQNLVLIELTPLKGRNKVSTPVYAMIQYDDE